MQMFKKGDLVQLNYSDHIGIVIGKSSSDWRRRKEHAYSYRIKWAVGEPFTWEKSKCLIMKVRVNNEKRI